MDSNDLERNHWNSAKPSPASARRPSFPDSRGAYKSLDQQVSESYASSDFKSPGIHVVDGGGSSGPSGDVSGDSDSDEEAGLDPEGRRKRRERKKSDTSLNGRVAGAPMTSKEERKLADKAVLRRSLVNVLLIALWYSFSLSISIYNKWMFSKDHLDFSFPLFTTSIHMVVQFALSSLVLFLFPRFRPSNAAVEDLEEEQEELREKKPNMSTKFYLTRIGPCGTATALDIGLGNMSLKTISLTFFTMCKSSALAFVLLWAFIFRLEQPSIKLILIILVMTAGVVMMVAGELAFETLGFILVLLSAFFSGFRWALTQILLLRNPSTSNPFSTLFFLTPWTFLALFLLSIPVGELSALPAGFSRLAEAKGAFAGVLLMLFPGVIAFCMMSAEYALLKRTSVVTLSICGIFKEVLTITASQIVYHDPLTPVNISGLIVTIASIAAYNYMKIRKMRKNAREEVKEHVEMEGEERRRMLAVLEEVEEEAEDEEDAALKGQTSGVGLRESGEGRGEGPIRRGSVVK